MAARLIDSLWVASYGSQLASGRAYFYAPGTTTPVTVYSDDAATVVVTQPVSLDANGRTTVPVYATMPMRAVLFNSAGSQVADIERIDGDRAELVALVNTWWPSAASVQAALTALATSLGTTNGLTKVTGTGAVGRSVQSKLSELPSVTDFGAVGSGIVDDFAAITSAITAVSAAGGGTLLVPDGNYLTSQTITLQAGVSLRGVGATASIITNSSTTGNAITGGLGLKRFFIEDIGIAASTASTGVGIYLNGCAYVTLSRVRVAGHRICVDTTDNGNASTANQYHRYFNCELINDANAAGRCVRMAGTVNVNGNSGNHMLLGNILSGSGATASTLIEIAGLSSNISLFGNVSVPDNQSTGVLVAAGHTGSGIYIVGNDFSNMTTTGLNIARATGPGLVEYANRWANALVDASDGVSNVLAGRYTSTQVRPSGVAFYTQTLAGSASATVDLDRANYIEIRQDTVATTVTIPAPLVSGSVYPTNTITFLCKNNTAGVVTWTFNAAYVTSAAVAPLAGESTQVTFVRIAASTWKETGRVTTPS